MTRSPWVIDHTLGHLMLLSNRCGQHRLHWLHRWHNGPVLTIGYMMNYLAIVLTLITDDCWHTDQMGPGRGWLLLITWTRQLGFFVVGRWLNRGIVTKNERQLSEYIFLEFFFVITIEQGQKRGPIEKSLPIQLFQSMGQNITYLLTSTRTILVVWILS